MNQVYNTQKDISSSLVKFLKKVGVWRKTQLKIIPFIVIGMILSFVLLLNIINLNTRMANFISLLTICFAEINLPSLCFL